MHRFLNVDMKKIYVLTFLFLGIFLLLQPSYAATTPAPKHEFRATWLTTHYRIDWPRTVASSASSSQIAAQKQELCNILDALRGGNLNATMLQVRPTADAFYQSSYEPWSHNLTDTRGKNPGYDPLAYAVEQAHARGLEMHAWVNPFRYEVTANSYGNVDIRAIHPEWLLYYNNGSYSGTILDPGLPEVRQYVTNVIMEMVNNYDIDGMIWDDYFYPYGGTTTEDAASKALYKPAGMSDGDWRRDNVNKTIQMIYDSIQVVKPWVRFGMAPFGIWTTNRSVAAANGLTLPQGITGLDDYAVQFCDPVAWARGGYVDYLAPQIYWPTTSSGQNYNKLAQWWGQSVCKHFSDLLPDGKQVHFFSANNDYSDWVSTSEAALEVQANRQYAPDDAPGAIFYNTNQYRSKGLCSGLVGSVFKDKALPPAMSWKAHEEYTEPTNLAVSGSVFSWQSPAERFVVYAYDKGVYTDIENTGSAIYQICYGHQINLSSLGDLSQKTLAVAAFDRFGNEFPAAYFNRAAVEEVDTIDVHVTGVSMRVKSHTMKVGETITLKAIVKPANATVQIVSWTSSNDAVASVDANGLVLGVANGEATISCTTTDGGFSADCVVTITGGENALEDVPAEMLRPTLIMQNGTLLIRRVTNQGEMLFSVDGKRVQ